MKSTASLLAALAVCGGGTAASAQQPPAPSPQPQAPPLEIGAVAPDFALSSATRFGLLRDPVHLSDFKGKTVVLAFFYKARTRG